MNLLGSNYGIDILKDKVIYLIRNTTEMYYDNITGTVYSSIEFFEKDTDDDQYNNLS